MWRMRKKFFCLFQFEWTQNITHRYVLTYLNEIQVAAVKPFWYAIAHPIKCPKFEKLNFKNYCMIKCLLGSVAPDCSINLPNLKHSRTRYLLAWSNFWNNLTGQLPYQCNICLKRFRLWSTMRKHTVRCTAKNSVKLEIDHNNFVAATEGNIQGNPLASVNHAFNYIQSRLLILWRNTAKYFALIGNY